MAGRDDKSTPIEKVSLSLPSMAYITFMMVCVTATAVGAHFKTQWDTETQIKAYEEKLFDKIDEVEDGNPPQWVKDILSDNKRDVIELRKITQANAVAITRLTAVTENLARSQQ